MMMRMGPSDSSGFQLLFGNRMQPARKDVQNDLKLTDDQKTKLADAQQKMQDGIREIMQNAGDDQEARQAAFQKYQENVKKDVLAILSKEQAARLRQINIQIAGNGAASFTDVQKDLGLTADQIAKIKDLQSKQRDAMMALFQKMRDQEITREEMQEASKKNSDALNTEIGKVLSADQKAKLKTMGGAEFKADKPADG